MKPQKIPSKNDLESTELVDLQKRYLIGWPGYRNARGRSGLGYVETQAEWAHVRGRILHMLITKKVITRNPIFLFAMLVIGLMYSLPLILGLPDFLAGGDAGVLIRVRFISVETTVPKV
jgi:hypothetical protein